MNALAITIKRKGMSLTYVPAEDGRLEAVREGVVAALTVSYDEDERRLVVAKRISYHQAFRRFRQETGQAMAIINASAETGAIYGCEESRAALFAGPTLPLTYLVDLALKSDARAADGRPLLVAIFFGPTGAPGVPLLAIGVNADRTLVLQDLIPSVADFATTVENILGAMVASNALRGLDFDPRQASRNEEVKRLEQTFQEERVRVVSVLDLAALAHEALSYPREPVYHGITRGTLSKAAFGASLAALATSLGVASAAEWLRRGAILDAAQFERSTQEHGDEVRAQLLDRLDGLAARVSLNATELFEAAEAIAPSGSKVTLAATLESSRITAIVPHTLDRSPRAIGRGAAGARDANSVVVDLRRPGPRRWTQSSIEIAGDFNAWLVTFTSAPVERDLLELVGARDARGARALDPVPRGPTEPASAARTLAVLGK
ncbi:MAG TPA: hypothetical protein VN878_01045 [Usitatibacter sp.]|nr:hypothetical protein [Usitatibacter sp.]